MRVLCPYEPTIHPLARAALAEHAPHAELIELGENRTAYWRLLHDLWAKRESFVLVEHDVEIHDRVVRAFTYCPEPWCVFAYRGPLCVVDGSQPLFADALGCTRFRPVLMERHPDVIAAIGGGKRDIDHERDWRGLDGRINGALRQHGYRPHVHEPIVRHHHDYPAGCSCGTEHEESAR